MATAARPAPTPAVGPYRVTCWSAGYIELGRFATFAEALRLYATNGASNKQLTSTDLADSGSSGLTDVESDAVYSLPVTRAATEAELAAALGLLEVA